MGMGRSYWCMAMCKMWNDPINNMKIEKRLYKSDEFKQSVKHIKPIKDAINLYRIQKIQKIQKSQKNNRVDTYR